MKLFGCRYSVCVACEVHFEPATGYQAQWGEYCPAHRAPIIKEYQRIERIVDWARSHPDKIEPLIDADEMERNKSRIDTVQAMYNAMSAQQAAGFSAQQSALGAFGMKP